MSAADIAANKKQALEQLRVKKQLAKSKTAGSSPHNSTPSSQGETRSVPPPAQSRDGTVMSRYFPPATPSMGKVLVPSSSPLQQEPHAQQPRTFNHPSIPNLAGSSGQPYAPPWAQRRGGLFTSDPLSAPTQFTSIPTSSNSDLRRQRPAEERAAQDDGRPRKRQNRGPSQDTEDASEVPSSPEINRAGGRRRRLTAGSSVDMSLSDDDALPAPSAILAGPSRSRFKERPSSGTSPASLPSPEKFYPFSLLYIGESDTRIRGAWVQAGGDQAKAQALMQDKNWTPSVAKVEKEVGRVKEIEEANKAQRAAVREKGKMSAIYANRPVLDTTAAVSTPPTSKAAAANDPILSPSTPFIPAARNKRVKRLVLSESEEESDDEEDARDVKKQKIGTANETRVLDYFNTRTKAALQELTDGRTHRRRISSRNSAKGRRRRGPAGLSPKLFDDSVAIFKGYGSVDTILEDWLPIASWSTPDEKAAPTDLPGEEVEDGALSLHSLAKRKDKKNKGFLTKQPLLLADKVVLKDYQLLGVNWLNLLYRRKLSCILADEMGLGKTIQVISFLAHLKEHGNKGPHLVVVPSSTLENWCREFARFAPEVRVQTYYANKDERPVLRQTLNETMRAKSRNDQGWEVLITTYNLAAQGDDRDRKFFRKTDWDCSIFDEGHVLKNFQSQRYQSLLKYGSTWRLLLTGTPLQNNLQELISLMNFILPEQFSDQFENIHAIFKAKGDAKVSLLSQERISRAKKMMTPFVLRRRKDPGLEGSSEQVRAHRVRSIYNDALQRSRKTILDTEAETPESTTPDPNAKVTAAAKKKTRPKDKVYLENSSNVLMDLRKAASHPMLFRTHFSDDNLSGITKQLLKEPDFKKRGAQFDIVKEDMTVMTDSELQVFVATYKSTRKYLKSEDIYEDAGKIIVLLKLLEQYRKEGRKILIFSQFTQILDILQAVLKIKGMKFLVLTGSTPVDVRQTLVDEFTEDESIPVFLLSTKAGGMGINLTAASVVIMFDQDFNPHNDRQAQDRAYRIGQKRDVDVVKLISKGTIEEEMLRLGETKLALDQAVAGEPDGKGESAPEKEMKTSLMKALRRQLERDEVKEKS
ncbi:P-loop containing nucleoside triphosphate hydrolase protein [Ephemerocybe angulata]|uniref:P-loop containing nucleoside triphosphate hydrolase protein n=1 Tax=Ephemerocybe angulata TaxID=980116 RepID=A0A8H6MEP7_9AGAR|nr:P-loop containing nucleoside triphosphate hydrolase protein [Tulosesus angulatus]